MASGFCFGVALLLSLWAGSKCDIPNGVHMECRDRYFMIAVDLSVTGSEPRFEAVDSTGVHAITEQSAAQCGYSISTIPFLGHMEFRASYFSCHTDNNDDEVFMFNFNLVATHEGKEATYALNKTCMLLLPWSPREVTCEVNYMEVSVRSETMCSSERSIHDLDSALKPALYSDWQVMFQRAEEQFPPINLSEAQKLGYRFILTDGRLVFRTPYQQPYSFSTEVNGVPVEVVHAVLFSRQSWVVLVVDLLAACSMHDGSYDNGYVMWETTELLHCLVSPLSKTNISIGGNGELVAQPVAEERGYIVEKHNTTVHVSIPYKAKGGYRKSMAYQGLYEYYLFNLYLEQVSVDEDEIAARLCFHRTLVTPLLPRPVFTENKTVLEENMFTIYLGNIPEDVELVSLQLNRQELTLPLTNASTCNITKVIHPNATHGYMLKVQFEDPVVKKQFSRKDVAMWHMLDINYTLIVLPENEPFSHQASVMALKSVSFDAVCSKSGITFKLKHRPFDYMWEITIGKNMLTSELANQHGYIMNNDSQSLQLYVPLFTHGYEYQNITLKGFLGTFELLVRARKTSEIQASAVKTCLFDPTEFIMCSPDGRMTVVADLSLAVPSRGSPEKTSLRDKSCGPENASGTKALFSVPVNSCGAIIKLGKESVTYENEIFFSAEMDPRDLSTNTDRVTLQCTYAVVGLHALFSMYKFESNTVGVGHIMHSNRITEGPTVEPTTASTTRHATRLLSRARYRPAQYIKVSNFLHSLSNNGLQGSSQVEINALI